MKKILPFTLLLATLSGAVSSYIVFFVPPESWQIIGLFLISTFFALSSILSFVSTLIVFRFSDPLINKQKVFQENLRRSILLSLAIIGIAALKILWALNLINTIFLISILLLVEIYFSKYRAA